MAPWHLPWCHSPRRWARRAEIPFPSSASCLAPHSLVAFKRFCVWYVNRLPFPVHRYRASTGMSQAWGSVGSRQRPPTVQGLPRCPGQSPSPSSSDTTPFFYFYSWGWKTIIIHKYKTGSLLTSELGKNILYVLCTAHWFRCQNNAICLRGPRCQVIDVLVLSSCPPGRCWDRKWMKVSNWWQSHVGTENRCELYIKRE